MSQTFHSRCVYLLLWLLCFSISLNAQLDNSCSITVNGGISTASSPRPAQQTASLPYLDHQPWTNLDNIYLPDNRFVETTLSPSRKSELLIVNNFDFSIPENAIIQGIEVRLIGGKTGLDSIHDKRIQLIDNTGALVGQNKRNKAIYGNEWSQDSLNNKENWKYGTNQDLWENNWTPQMINGPAFGLGIQVQNLGSNDVKVMLDQVMIRIYYIPAIDICESHACISIYTVPEANVIDYDWNVSSDLVHQDSTNVPYVINVYADQSPYGDYEVCLTKTYFNNTTSTCCRNITYRPCDLGSIGNYVWLDTNGNGNQDSGEPALDNIRVFLYNESEDYLAESVTENGGQYRFDGLKPGNYFVHVSNYDYCPTVGQGLSDNTDSDFLQAIKPLMSKLVTLAPNQNITNIDFGLINKGSISGLAWIDKDGNGQLNGDDETVAGLEVQLQNTSGDVIQTTITDNQGDYIFEAVPPGDYVVYFVFADEFINTSIGYSLIDDSFKTSVVMLENGGVLDDINAGVYRPSTIGDLVWYDANENGIFDNSESGLPNTTVFLEDCSGNMLGEVTTDSSGYYSFNQVPPGNFIICAESDRSDLRPLETASVNITGVRGCSECITLSENSNITNVDFAMINAFVEVNVNVWFDNNTNGFIDSTEFFVNGAEVNLFDCAGTLIESAITNASGFANFDSLLTGSYYVELIAPNGEQLSMASNLTNANGIGTTDCEVITPPSNTFNLGLIQLSSIGDFVWNDLNRDGQQSQNEPGLPDVTVTLLDCNSEIVTETTTDSLGAYSFTELLTGEYTICTEYNNADFIPTISNGVNPESDSNFSDTLSMTCTDCFYVAPDADVSDIDFGYMRKQSAIIVNIWEDLNYSNTNDAEPSASSIDVTLYNCSGQLLRSTVSDSNGVVTFNELFLEEYYIEITLEDGISIHPNSIFTDANGPLTTDCFLLSETPDTIEIPLVELSTIGNFVWIDENANGLQDDSEAGLANVGVSLQDCNGVLMAETITDIDGAYAFTDVVPGEYVICLDNPGDFFSPTDFVASNDAQNSDFDLSNSAYCSECFSVTAFVDNLNIDFGFTRDVSNITVEVWYDNDGDGRFDSDEIAASGVEIKLFECSGLEVASALVDNDGNVAFNDVGLGSYYIEAEDLSGFNFSENTSISNDNGVGTSSCFNHGVNGTELEVGYVSPASIGDFVWLDVNDNGRQDPDEVGVEGVELSLLNANGVIQQSVTSDINGQYLFDNLSPGVYRIILVNLNASYSLTRSGQASEELDSDFDAVGSLISTSIITLVSNQSVLNVDLGLVPAPSQVSGLVWRDSNGNLLNDNEPGQENVTVGLYDCTGVLVEEQTTNDQGEFVFVDVPVGDYYVAITADNDLQYLIGGESVISNTNGTNTSDCFVVDGSPVDLMIGATPMSNMRTQVFIDENANGIIEVSDTYLSNVLVVLRDIDDNQMDMKLTDTNGEVAFDDIYPGQYRLELMDIDTGLVPTLVDQGDEMSDSDLYFEGGRFVSDSIDIYDGEAKEDIDLGLMWVTTSKVAGEVWRDSNGDLVLNGESGFEGLSVQLFTCTGELYESAITDVQGYYEFIDIPNGEYYLKFEDHSAFELEADLNTNFSSLNSLGETTCFAIENVSQVHFDVAMIPYAQIGDFVWRDENGNGQQDIDEPGVQGLEILLLDESDAVVATTFTDGNGLYAFENIKPSTYRLEVANLFEDFNPTVSLSGDEETDSNLNLDNGRYISNYFSITDGIDNLTIDLGLVVEEEVLYSINGTVWEDLNGDGVLDIVNEPGQNEILVSLYDNNDMLIATQTTAENSNGEAGYYAFTNVEQGSYYLTFELDSDAAFTLMEQGSSDDFDSHIGLGSKTNLFDITSSSLDNFNAGYYYPGSIGDFVWLDANFNGSQDADELGVENVVLELYNSNDFLIDTYESSSDSATLGSYIFENIRPDNYYVKVSLPEGYVFTSALSGGILVDSDVTNENGEGTTYTINLLSNQNIQNVDIGLIVETGQIGDLVWEDVNGNGVFDSGEQGVGNIAVRLHTFDDAVVDETITSVSGNYIFFNVEQGEYYVSIDLPANFDLSPSNASTSELDDSNFDIINGLVRSDLFQLSSGEVNNSIDAGIFSPAQIGDFVWIDYNANGIQDADESGYENMVVQLFTEQDELVATTLTDTEGQYLFTDVAAGDYYVQFVLSGDLTFTEGLSGSNINVDSDANVEGITDLFSIAPREVRRDIDAGVISPINIISGKTWYDSNEDGLQQMTEAVAPNVLVWLLDSTGTFVMDETETDEFGNYAFYDIEDGTYVLQFLPLSGYAFTGQYFGSDASIDSDVDEKGYTSKLILTGGATVISDISAGYVDITKQNLSKLYPNPVFGENIQLDINNIYPVADIYAAIYDAQGSLIKETQLFRNLKIGNYKSGLSLDGLKEGVYMIQIKIGRKTEYHRIMMFK